MKDKIAFIISCITLGTILNIIVLDYSFNFLHQSNALLLKDLGIDVVSVVGYNENNIIYFPYSIGIITGILITVIIVLMKDLKNK